ncbi:ABC transporter ATP-binding protein/permease [Agrobacterium sp. T29]|uniref:ABC transporter ATP-binding protein/permease n=1 Tax=Agrobacterium sp. T29 TaxID=2580515 RepID=UPI00115DF300|nr:ABC transporter ATP-binding protein/permease [Agrobacterium sp. T29]
MQTFRAFLRIAKPFWFSRNRLRAWLLLATMVVCALGFVRVSVAINAWNKVFFDALASFDAESIPHLAGLYLSYLALAVAFIAAGNWFMKRLAFDWRSWTTDEYQNRWLKDYNHYRMRFGHEPDNPDQRIAEDIALLSEKSLDLFKSFVLNVTRLYAFTAILWTISGTQDISIAGLEFRVSGYLVWLAIIYAVLSTAVMHYIGRKLLPLNIERQKREADYRAALISVRSASEQIAFHRGEQAEARRLERHFARIKTNWSELIGREFKIECFSAAQMRIAWFIPLFSILPLYLGRTISFGDLMQAQNAFSSVLDGLNWFLNYYRKIMEWAAVVQRLSQFDEALNTITAAKQHKYLDQSNTKPAIHIENANIFSREGQRVLSNLNMHFPASGHVLLTGRSGCGKTTMLRALAGLWPYCSGQWSITPDAMFLPQRAYFPEETLRHVVSYPASEVFSDDAILRALEMVGLSTLSDDLGRRTAWSTILSGGEQQRIGFARLLLHRPQVMLLDEATSHLDTNSARSMYEVVRKTLPDCLLVAVTHQRELASVFDIEMNIVD